MKDPRAKSDMLRFRRINKHIKGKDILDIGSSEGNIHKLLIEHNKDRKFYTLDFKNADYNIDLNNPKKLNRKFDTVIAGEIIEHLESPVRFIRYCRTLLKKNGTLILTTPNAAGLQYILNPAWCVYYKDYGGHSQAFTMEMLKMMLEDEGFKIAHSEYVNAFWINNPLEYVSLVIRRLRPDLMVVGKKL